MPIFAGVVTGKVRFVPEPAATVKLRGACGLARDTERVEEALVRFRIDDIEGQHAFDLFIRGVIDHYLQVCPVAFA